MKEPDYIAPLLAPEGLFALGYLLGAWMAFKDNHDLKSENLQCREKILALFEALDNFESIMLGKK